MVRSCSIIIFSVYVLCDVSINEAVSQKQNTRSEEEGTGTRHAVVTELEFMFSTFLGASVCNTGERKITLIYFDVILLLEYFSFVPVQKPAENLLNLFRQSVCPYETSRESLHTFL
jgi:hypothetical protein